MKWPSMSIITAPSSSDAISFLANGLDWRAGDEVVSVESEFPFSFVPHAGSAEGVMRFLQRQRILVAARGGKVRVAPHFYNTEPEIDRVLELLGSYESLDVL